MKQREVIERLINNSEEQKKKALFIQNKYEEYFFNRLNLDFEKMLSALEDYCLEWVKRHLQLTGCYSEEIYNDAIQESRLAVWNIIINDMQKSVIRPDFTYYAFGIYKNKTMDEIRKYLERKKHIDTDLLISQNDDSERTYEDKLPPVEFEDLTIKKEQKELFAKLFLLYCKAFLDTKTFPPRPLALFYARVLPHLLDAIPDGKASSAKWAVERIGVRKISELCEDSEKYLRKNVDDTLKWGNNFKKQLEDVVDIDMDSVRIRDIIYTEKYDKGKIEDWADYMHRATAKVLMKNIVEDEKLLGLVEYYIIPNDNLYKDIFKESRS